MEILSAKDLCKSYGSGENSVQALNHVSISIENGEFVAVIGTSGSGKSTLLNLLGGLDTPTSGEVLISGKKLFQMNEEARTIFRRRNIGFVFQNYNLVPVLNVYENIVLPIELDGTKVDTEYVKTILHTLGLEQKYRQCPISFLAVSNNVLPLHGHWQQNRQFSWQMNLQEIWIAKRGWMSLPC